MIIVSYVDAEECSDKLHARTPHQCNEENVYSTCCEAAKCAKSTLLINGIQFYPLSELLLQFLDPFHPLYLPHIFSA